MNEQSPTQELNMEKYKNQSALMDACIANVEKARAQRDAIKTLSCAMNNKSYQELLDMGNNCVQISENTLLTQIRIINLENQSEINEKRTVS